MKTKKEPSLNTVNSEIEVITSQNNHAELGQIEVQQFTGFKLLRNVFEEKSDKILQLEKSLLELEGMAYQKGILLRSSNLNDNLYR
jgi:hypothetical protein